MAYKVFSNGDALTGGELNTYLMNQSVMVFASTTARDAALTAPIEGQLVWLEDSNKYVYYTGSAWSDLITPASSGNAIINGAFDINQRSFSSSTTNLAYTFDRWQLQTSSGGTASAQTFTPGTAPVTGYESKNFLRLTTVGQTGTTANCIIGQPIEDVRTFAGQTVTVSFWAKAASGTPKVALEMTQVFGAGGSGDVSTPSGTVTLSTSWARYSITVAIPSITGKTIAATNGYLSQMFWVSAGTDFNTRASSIGIQNNTFDFWGVQVESGSTATAFKRNANSLQGELAACQRYFQIYGGYEATGNFFSSSAARLVLPLKVTMRVAPTMTYPTGTLTNYIDQVGVGGRTPSAISGQTSSINAATFDATGMSGGTGGYLVIYVGAQSITASAEL